MRRGKTRTLGDMDPGTTPATVFLRNFLFETSQGRTCLVFSALAFVSGLVVAAFPAQVAAWRLLAAGRLLLAFPIVLFLVAFAGSNITKFESSTAVAVLVAIVGVLPFVFPFIPDAIIVRYLPHPFFVASVFLFAFAWWTLVSERRRARKQHPKTLRPLRLVLEGLGVGLAISAMCFTLPLWTHEPLRSDAGSISIVVVVGLASAGAYIAAPYMGYNFLWNTRIFDAWAMWLALAAAMTFLLMGMETHFAS